MSTNPIPTQSASWSVRCYRQLMRIYPKEFTTTFGDSVDQAFRDLARDAFRERGRLGVLLLWFRIVPDFVFSAIELFTTRTGDYLKWNFRLRWLIACSVGFAFGSLLVRIVVPLWLPKELAAIPLWLTLGLIQSYVLTNKLCDRTRWVFFSVAGAAIGYTLVMGLIPFSVQAAAARTLPIWALRMMNVPAAVIGAIIGLFQWWALRKTYVNASRWILACSSGLFAMWLIQLPAVTIIQFVPWALGFGYTPELFGIGSSSLIAGAAFGIITAAPLERILRLQQVPSAPPEQTLPSE